MSKTANPKSFDDKDLSINDYFPNEILEEILSKLFNKSDICHAKLVCQRWRFVVNEMVGLDVSVTNYGGLINEKALFDPSTPVKNMTSLAQFSNIAIRNLKFGIPGMLNSDYLTQMIKRITKDLSELPRLTYLHVLKSLSCFEPLPSNIFTALTPMRNLTYLNISLFSLSSLTDRASFQNLFPLRCLNTLIISNSPAYPDFNNTCAISPLNNLLEQLTAPNLSVLDITYPILSLVEINDDSTHRIINLIKRSFTINKLCISVFSSNQNFFPPPKQFQYPMDLMEEMKTLGSKIRPRCMELKDNHLHSIRPSVQTKAWIELIKQQMHLSSLKLYLQSSVHLADVVAILEKNEKALKNLNLSCFPCDTCAKGDVYFLPIDGRTLAKCCTLKRLMLSDKVINTIHLPHSLRYIYVNAMLTNVDAHNLILTENTNLRQIDLHDIRGGSPKAFGYGVSLETLYQFVKKRTVHRLVIYAGSTDDKFPSEGIPNGDVDNPKHLRKRKPSENMNHNSSRQRQAQKQPRIDWQLNARGFYQDNNCASYEENQNKEKNQDANHSAYKCERLILSFH